MSAIDVYTEEQITVAQQAILQITDCMMYPIAERWQPEDGNVRSEIHFVNRWKGIYLMECTRPMAVGLASLMLAQDEDQLSEADIADVLGEILNTIAGNLKCLLPSETELSIPFTLVLPEERERIMDRVTRCTEQSEVVLEGDLGRMKLSLWHCE